METVSVAPPLPALDRAPRRPGGAALADRAVVLVSAISLALALAATGAAVALGRLVALVTNLAWLHRASIAPASPGDAPLGAGTLAIPVVGGLAVGLLARYGSAAIRGHGIPEAMERILVDESRIPARITFLKPLSAAIAIGTGGPFGAEGPVIATGGALGSLVGQVLRTTAIERRTLLAAGAAAGMAATFGTPLAAALLAVELLLFEFRPRSLVPVALAAATAAGARAALSGGAPVFPLALAATPGPAADVAYALLGAGLGAAAVAITRAVYAVEDAFERLPVHWMWWPAIGGLAVGAVGLAAPRTLGVGYDNIERLLDGRLALGAAAALAAWKLASWAVALGSGTSGGTLAPLLTIGGGAGAAAGGLLAAAFPAAGIDPRVAALVGMAATFAGASRAALTSIVFALEATQAPAAVVPLVAGTSAAFLVSWLLMRHSIMTERIARRGVPVVGEYEADLLERVLVRDVASRDVVTLRADEPLAAARAFVASAARGSAHQGYPVVDRSGALAGVVTRRDLLDPAADPAAPLGAVAARPALAIAADAPLREAVELMVEADVGRLPVLDAAGKLAGMLTRSDVLAAHRRRIAERRRPGPGRPDPRRPGATAPAA